MIWRNRNADASGDNYPTFHSERTTAKNGSSITQVKNFITSHSQMLLGIFIGLAIVEGAALFYTWRYKAQQSELARYELQDFQTHQFNPLVAKVESQGQLIQAYGIQQTVQEACVRK